MLIQGKNLMINGREMNPKYDDTVVIGRITDNFPKELKTVQTNTGEIKQVLSAPKLSIAHDYWDKERKTIFYKVEAWDDNALHMLALAKKFEIKGKHAIVVGRIKKSANSNYNDTVVVNSFELIDIVKLNNGTHSASSQTAQVQAEEIPNVGLDDSMPI